MTARDRRALRIGAVVVAFGLLVRLVPAALAAESRLRTGVVERTEAVARMQADLAQLGALERIAGEVQERLVELAPRLVSGRTKAEANAALVAAVRSLAERAGMKVERVGSVADTTRVGGLTAVVAHLQGEADATGLQSALRALATDDMTLEVRALQVVATNPSASDGLPERLGIQLTVRGWWLAPNDTSAGSASGRRQRGER